MISSIPVLMIQRSLNETLSLLVFSEMIPSTSIDKPIKQKVIQRLINFYGPAKKRAYDKSNARDLKVYNKYKAMIDEGILIPDYIRDPVQKFFIKAIVDKKNWSQLIIENDWDKLFGNQQKKAWSIYEQWITFICYKGFKNKQAYVLSCHLTKNNHSMIENYRKSSNRFFEIKFKNLMKKSVNQLNLIHYENQKNLLISIKLKQSLEQTMRRLDFQKILQCPQNSFGVDFNKWTEFLCTKFEGNRPPIKPVLYEQIFNWKAIDQKYQKSQCTTKYQQYQQKLQFIINRYTNFQASFTNQVQASLLKDLQQQNNWKIAKFNVNTVIERTRSLSYNVKGKQKGEADQKNHKMMQDLELLPNQNSNITNFIKEEPLATQTKYSYNNQVYTQQTWENTKETSSEIEYTRSSQKIKTQNSQQKINHPVNNLSQEKHDTFPFQRQLQKINQKFEQTYKNETKFSNNHYLQQAVSSMYISSKIQQDTIQINLEQFPIKHEQDLFQKFRQYQLQKQKEISQILQDRVLSSERNYENDEQLMLSTEQNLILSLLRKAHESLQQFKNSYFQDISQDSLQHYLTENNDIIKPMHHSILNICRCNQNSDTINNQNIRNMIQIILNIDLAEQNLLLQEKPLNLMLSQQQMVKQFSDGFDRLIKKFSCNHQSIKTEKS